MTTQTHSPSKISYKVTDIENPGAEYVCSRTRDANRDIDDWLQTKRRHYIGTNVTQ
jgi:hypothetical protein